MAWLKSQKRRKKRTGRLATYWSISFRDERGKTRQKALGFVDTKTAKEALKAFEARVLLGLRIEPAQAPTLRSSSTDEAITLSVFLETIGGFESIEHVSM